MTTEARLIRHREDRVLEDAAYAQHVVPTRIFHWLLPVWRVEIRAMVTDGEPYDLIDRFLERGIEQAGLGTVTELADFFCLDEVVVDRAVRFLSAIGHVTMSGGQLGLTELGRHSVRDNTRYVVTRQDRRTLYFDAFASRPLPRAYYETRTVTLLGADAAASVADGRDWPRFTMLYSRYGLRANALTDLARQPGRDHFNLPARIDDPEFLGTPECVFLPMYVVRGVQRDGRPRLLAYTQAGGGTADLDISGICEQIPEIACVAEAEELGAREGVLDKARMWLERKGVNVYQLSQREGGQWQAALPASGFGGKAELPLSKVGSFIVLNNDVLRLWCADEQVRRQALLERADAYLGARSRLDHDEAQARIAQIARQLDLGSVGLPELHRMAVQAGKPSLAAQLASLMQY